MKKLLIVDDSPFFRGIVKDALFKPESGFTEDTLKVVEAKNKETTFSQIDAHNPDLVILDVVMEDSERAGVEILKEIRKLHPALKVIILSSVGQTDIVKECEEYGIIEYLEKPFEPEKLITVVKKYL